VRNARAFKGFSALFRPRIAARFDVYPQPPDIALTQNGLTVHVVWYDN